MASIAQLNEKITELETAWSTENQEISTKLTSLQDEVTRLREVIANQGTPEDIDAAIARIDAIITDVKDTVTEEGEPEQPQP